MPLKYLLLFFYFWCTITILLAQNDLYQIKGEVRDQETGEALPGALVMVHELHNGTITNTEGEFIFKNLKRGSYHLHVTFVGYQAALRTVQILEKDVKVEFELPPSSLELKEIVIEANPLKNSPEQQSLAVQSIEKDFLEKNNSGTLVNTIQKIPGINAINTGVGIAKPVIRGMSFNRVIVNDKGVKQEGQQWGADHGLEIDQYEPERIEIIKGPASLLYGSDGIGGVINVQPAGIPTYPGLAGSLMGIYKSNNGLIGSSTMLQGKKDGKFFRVRFSTQDFGDYEVPAENFTYNGYVLNILNNRLKNTAGQERNITAMAGIQKNWGFSKLTISNFNQQSGLFSGAVGIPRQYQLDHDGDYRNIALPRQKVNHFKVVSNSNFLIGKDWLEMDIGYQYNHRREEGNPHAHGYQPNPEGNLALGLHLQTISGNIKLHQEISESLRHIYGLQFQYQKNRADGFEFLLPAFTSGSIGAYAYEERNFSEKFTVNGGLRFDYGNRQIQGHREPDYSTIEPTDSITRNNFINRKFYNFSGSAGLSYSFTKKLNVKFNLGSSFRMPTSPELVSNGIHHGTFRHEKGDPDLTSERGWQADFGFTYQTHNFSFNLSPYFSYFNNYLYLKPTPRFSQLPGGGQIYQYTQTNAIYSGGELSSEYHIIKNLHFGLGLEYVWNYNLESGLGLPFTPPASGMIDLEYDFNLKSDNFSDFYLNINLHRYLDQNRVDRNEAPTPGYLLTGFGAGIHLHHFSVPLQLKLNVQNLFDVDYMNHLSRYRLLNLPEQGRNIAISLKVPIGQP